MAESRVRESWSRTASLMALVANAARDPKRTKPFRASDFDPFAKKKESPTVGVEILKDVFMDGRVPRQGGQS